MPYNNTTNSSFDKLVRINKKQLLWLKENKDTKTVAGFLDKIINEYKHGSNKSVVSDKGGSDLQQG